jgi:quinolinate synthase
MIIFSGVKFMAEMTAVLSPDIPVFIPANDALCPLAAYVDAEKIREVKAEHPDTPVAVYVNTTAETKSEADIVVTSGSAVDIIKEMGVKKIIFGPDANLAEYVRRLSDVEIIDIEPRGHCYVHRQFDVAQIALLREEHPDAIVIAHPECSPEVQDVADLVGSTGMMVRTVAESEHKKFIIATELGLVQQLQAMHPDKIILPAYEKAVCRQMKKNSLEKILHVLQHKPKENLVTVPSEMVPHILGILERMNLGPEVKSKIAAQVTQ